MEKLIHRAIDLLKQLISTPSFSKEEDGTADILLHFFEEYGIALERLGNNLYVRNKHFDPTKKTILLNSHHDTVRPNKGYTLDPFAPIEKDGKLYGLGSNDAGGCLVCLIATFLHFYDREGMTYNLLFAASSEEEISGPGGIERLLPHLGNIDCGIVGEPTLLDMAIAERGLMVVDCTAKGIAGHAARKEGVNALYIALEDIDWIRNYRFEKNSPLLGASMMTVTSIYTDNKQHNVVPPQCSFVVDVRINELYSFEEVLSLLKSNLKSVAVPRSMRLKSTSIPLQHPLVQAGLELGRGYYGSPTTSDKAMMDFPTIKMGPGDSARSHTADEFIYLHEIEDGVRVYVGLVERMVGGGR